MRAPRKIALWCFALVAAGMLVTAGIVHGYAIQPRQPVTRSITYKGALTQGGSPANGLVALQFGLHATRDGSEAPLWTATWERVTVDNGRFSVTLGDEANPIPDAVFELGTAYLSVSINGTPLAGRQQITAAPYAVRTSSADYAVAALNGVNVGTIVAYAGATPPAGWLLCDGAEYARDAYPELAAVLQSTFGAASADTFHVPDMRGRVAVGAGAGAGLIPRALGETFGVEKYTLTLAEMPVHSHVYVSASAFNGYPNGGNDGGGSHGYWRYKANPSPASGAAGGGQAHNIMQPSLVLTYIIKY